MKRFTFFILVILLLLAGASSVLAGPQDCSEGGTTVPGQCGRSGPVTGHYTLEDYGGCDYVVNYRGDFGPDPYLDNGWIINSISCDDGSHYMYLIVHESDPRYEGNPDWAIWGNWEYHVLTISGTGNLVRPEHHVG